MRHLFSVILFVFVQLISQQYASGQKCSTAKTDRVKEKSSVKSPYYKLSKKHSSSFKKILFEDAPFIHSTLKKTGLDYPLSFGIPECFKQYQFLSIKIYNSFLYSSYSFIFDYLYPKHVFW